MTPREQLLGGSWYIPPLPQDWVNLDASRVRHMLLGFSLCRTHPQVLDALHARGVSVLIRMSDEDFRTTLFETVFVVVEQTMARVTVEGLIFYNEPEGELDLREGSPTWGNQPSADYPNAGGKLQFYRARATAFIGAYKVRFPTGPPLIAGAQSCRWKGPTEAPWPGSMAWTRVMFDGLQGVDKWGAHVYTENYNPPYGGIDLERLQYAAQVSCSLGRPPYIIDEIGVLHKPEANQVRAYLDFCRYLLGTDGRDGQAPGRLGRMVERVIPFVWAGDPQGGKAWSASYLLSDPASYVAIGQFIQNG